MYVLRKLCGRDSGFSKKVDRVYIFQEHRTIHTGEVLYACEYCGKPINRKTYLYSHIKRKHPTEWAQKKQMATQRTEVGLQDLEDL